MNARVRRFDSSTISTSVRNALQLYAVRLEFLVGGRIAPRAFLMNDPIQSGPDPVSYTHLTLPTKA